MLILAGGPDWLRWAGVASVAALAAFALSRTVGLFEFTERGWQPSPHAAVSVIAEVLTVALVAASVLSSRSKTAATTAVTQIAGASDTTGVHRAHHPPDTSPGVAARRRPGMAWRRRLPT